MTRQSLILFAAIYLHIAGSENALAWCSEPSMWSGPPSAPGAFSKPNVPYCFSGYSISGKHSCDSWEIESYLDEVQAYVSELRRYADDARSFAEDAIDYSSAVVEYVNCEIEEVAQQ